MDKEYEFKFICKEKVFRFIFNKLQDDYKGKCSLDLVKQKNYYFDNEDFIYDKNNITIRIREIRNVFILTIKDKRNYVLDLPVSFEKNIRLSQKEFCKILKNGLNIEKYFTPVKKTNSLKCLGHLTTIRSVVKINDLSICFDENLYLGNKDFEIEVEGNLEEVNLMIEYLVISRDKLNMIGKRRRFINRLNLLEDL